MILNLHAWTTIGCAAALSSALPLAAQVPCPHSADFILAAGWRPYRGDSIGKANERFESAQRLCPENLDASVGLGFTRLRLGDAKAADDVRALLNAVAPEWDRQAPRRPGRAAELQVWARTLPCPPQTGVRQPEAVVAGGSFGLKA